MGNTFDFTSGVAQGRTGRNMSGGQMVDACSSGVPISTIVNPGASYTLKFAEWGDIGYRLVPEKNCSLSLSGGNMNELQKITLIIQQPPTGNCEITLPSNINWTNKPFIDSQIGSVSILEIMFDGGMNYYGRLIYG